MTELNMEVKKKFWKESEIFHTLYIYSKKISKVKECHVLWDLD
jgi:hypothetical protein